MMMGQRQTPSCKSRKLKDSQLPPATGKRKRGVRLESQKESDFADTLISGFQPPRLSETLFLLFQATRFVVLGYSSTGDPIGMPRSAADGRVMCSSFQFLTVIMGLTLWSWELCKRTNSVKPGKHEVLENA